MPDALRRVRETPIKSASGGGLYQPPVECGQQDRLSKAERVKRFGEVFTPPHIVSDMCDMLEDESPGAFAPGTTFLEPTCGDGAFVLEVLRRKFQNCRKRSDYTDALRSVDGMELQADNVAACIENVTALCQKFFAPTKAELQIINDHIIQADALKVMKMMSDPALKEE